jgi:hypothetical protein
VPISIRLFISVSAGTFADFALSRFERGSTTYTEDSFG